MNITPSMKKDVRKIHGKVIIDYTDPHLDESIEIASNENARYSFPEQTANNIEEPHTKIASLDGSWELDGSYGLLNPTKEMGWWGRELSGVGGSFSGTPSFPMLSVQFNARPIRSIKVVGDVLRNEHPVDFDIELYDINGLKETIVITGNTNTIYEAPVEPAITEIIEQRLIIKKWGYNGSPVEGRQAKILEFYTAVQEIYDRDKIISFNILEEKEVSTGTLPIGNISANEISLTIDNTDGRFFPGNVESPLRNLLKANRRIRPYLGVLINSDFFPQEASFQTSSATNWPIGMHITINETVRLRNLVFYAAQKTNYTLAICENFIPGNPISPSTMIKTVTKACHIGRNTIAFDTLLIPGEYWIGKISAGGFAVVDTAYNTFPVDSELEKITLNKFYRDNGTEISGWAFFSEITFDLLQEEEEVQYVPMGEFWSLNWYIPENEAYVKVVGRDRLDQLQKTEFKTSEVLIDTTLYDLALEVLNDAGLTSNDYIVDENLQDYEIPYAWFGPMSHREALRRIASACMGQVYCDRNGKIVIEDFNTYSDVGMPYLIDKDLYYNSDYPILWDTTANKVTIKVVPYKASATLEEIYTQGNIEIEDEFHVTAFYNQSPCIDIQARLENETYAEIDTTRTKYYSWGADVYITSTQEDTFDLIIEGKVIKPTNISSIVVSDPESIREQGEIQYEIMDNYLIQTKDMAQTIAGKILSVFKEGRRNMQIEWRGDPTLQLGDVVQIPLYKDMERDNFNITSQEFIYDGGLSVITHGIKVVKE